MNEIVKIENNQIIVAEQKIEQIIAFEKEKARMDMQEKELKEALKTAMEKVGIDKFSVKGLCANIKKATVRKSIDTKRLKEEAPDVYEAYLKESPVASSITLTFE